MSDGDVSVGVETFVRAPAEMVFDAFVEPARLTAFWLASASAPLAPGARVRWEFLVPGAVDEVECITFDRARRLAVRSGDGSIMTWELTARTIDGASGTVVRVTQTGLSGSPDERIATALEATQGFTHVLADLKMLLETGTARGIVRDKAALIAAAAK